MAYLAISIGDTEKLSVADELIRREPAAIIRPLLCATAGSECCFSLDEALSGEDAERIGLVSTCLDAEPLHARDVESSGLIQLLKERFTRA